MNSSADFSADFFILKNPFDAYPVKEDSIVLSDKTVILGSHAELVEKSTNFICQIFLSSSTNARMENSIRLIEVVDSSNGEQFY